MPTARSQGQTLIGCWSDQALVEKIDSARGPLSRSQFCRDALAEKLESMGFKVTREEIVAPDRSGKGGPRRTPSAVSSVPTAVRQASLEKGVGHVQRRPAKSSPSPATGEPSARKDAPAPRSGLRQKPRPGTPTQVPSEPEDERD